MSDPQANAQLELCCRVGSVDGVMEALEEGADINCGGGSPLFIAIMAGDRALVSALIGRGADTSAFGIAPEDHDDLVAALVALAPSSANPAETVESEADPVDAKLVRTFDRIIRKSGLGGPLLKGGIEEYRRFRRALEWLAAEECEACVSEFLKLWESGGGENAGQFLGENAELVSVLTKRYGAAEDLPVDLLKDYLKEQKKRGSES